MERTNFRYVTGVDLTEGLPEFATIDVSFISLKLILPVLKTLLVPGSDVIALVKPQFEAGKANVGKKGVVRDAKVHINVLETIAAFSQEVGFTLKNASFSPITGGEGNIEFLFHLVATETNKTLFTEEQLKQIVRDAHQQLS